MVSDYFVLTPAERKKLHNDETAIVAEVQRRIGELKDYIGEFFRSNIDRTTEHSYVFSEKFKVAGSISVGYDTQGNWVNAGIFDIGASIPIRVFFSRAYFEQLAAKWTQERRIKIDEQDWRYLIYQILKADGGGSCVSLSWADSTLAICMDIPPIISDCIKEADNGKTK